MPVAYEDHTTFTSLTPSETAQIKTTILDFLQGTTPTCTRSFNSIMKEVKQVTGMSISAASLGEVLRDLKGEDVGVSYYIRPSMATLLPALKECGDPDLMALGDMASRGLVNVQTLVNTIDQKGGIPTPAPKLSLVRVVPPEAQAPKILKVPTAPPAPRIAVAPSPNGTILTKGATPAPVAKPAKPGYHLASEFREPLKVVLDRDPMGVMTRDELRDKIGEIVRTIGFDGDQEMVPLNGAGHMSPRWHRSFNVALLYLVRTGDVLKEGNVYRLKSKSKPSKPATKVAAFKIGDLVKVSGSAGAPTLEVRDIKSVGRGFSYTLAFGPKHPRAGTIIPGGHREMDLVKA